MNFLYDQIEQPAPPIEAMNFAQAQAVFADLKGEINSHIVMDDNDLTAFAGALLVGEHILLPGGYGKGKTALAKTAADAMGGTMKRLQGTPETLPSVITGYMRYDQAKGEYVFEPGLALGSNVLLADELPRTTSGLQAGLLEAMEEEQVTVEGQTYPVESPFIVLGTANPGRGHLEGALTDRFAGTIHMASMDSHLVQQIDSLKARKAPHRQVVNEIGQLVAAGNSLLSEISLGREAKTRRLDIGRIITEAETGKIKNDYFTLEGKVEPTFDSRRPYDGLELFAKIFAFSRREKVATPADVNLAALYALPHRLSMTYEQAYEKRANARGLVARLLQQQLSTRI